MKYNLNPTGCNCKAFTKITGPIAFTCSKCGATSKDWWDIEKKLLACKEALDRCEQGFANHRRGDALLMHLYYDLRQIFKEGEDD